MVFNQIKQRRERKQQLRSEAMEKITAALRKYEGLLEEVHRGNASRILRINEAINKLNGAIELSETKIRELESTSGIRLAHRPIIVNIPDPEPAPLRSLDLQTDMAHAAILATNIRSIRVRVEHLKRLRGDIESLNDEMITILSTRIHNLLGERKKSERAFRIATLQGFAVSKYDSDFDKMRAGLIPKIPSPDSVERYMEGVDDLLFQLEHAVLLRKLDKADKV